MVLVLIDPKGAFLLITSALRLAIFLSLCVLPINYSLFYVQVLNIHAIIVYFYCICSISYQ